MVVIGATSVTVSTGGRVLSVTASGEDLAAARQAAYDMLGRVGFAGAQYRTDFPERNDEEWLKLIVGLWTLVSPWVFGFQGTTAMTVHVVIGAAVAILAAIELWMVSPPRLTTGR